MTKVQQFDAHFEGVAKYFSPTEIRFMGGGNSQGSAFGKNTLPPEDLWDNIVPTLEMADKLREFFGAPLRVLSVYRSPAYNKAIGGESNSFHMRFMAMDLQPLKATKAEIARLKGCVEILVKKGVLTGGVGFYSWGVHIDCGPKRSW